MSLQFVMGPSGSGKSHYLYQWVTKEALEHPGKNYIVLVPEQFTMQTQKDLVMASPHKGILMCVCVPAQSLSHVRLCNPMDCNPPGSSVHGIFQGRILE